MFMSFCKNTPREMIKIQLYTKIKQMKQIIFIIALSSLLITSCSQKETIITGQLISSSDIKLFYTVPASGTNYLGFRDTLKIDEFGNFKIKLEIVNPVFISIWSVEPYKIVKLLVEPGNTYQILMDLENEIKMAGANEKGQMLYATLPNPSLIEMELRNWLQDTAVSITSIHHQINDLKQADLAKFKDLLDSKEITKSYFELIQKDRDCYYASLEARFLLIKSYTPIRLGMKIDDELLENLKAIYDKYSPNDENLLLSSFWSEYAKWYVEDYKQIIQEDFNIQKFQNLRNAGMYSTYIINESKKYMSGKALEFFQANHIYFTCIQARSSFEKELILLFEQFEKDYPQSEYSKYLKPYIDKIIDYYRIIDMPFQSILFMDNYETIITLEEAIKSLYGKKIYIDVWATWCGPCIKEFDHNEALKKVLAENDIHQLYISIDSDSDDQKWKDAIKYYNLTGTHIRANVEFEYSLRKLYSKNAERPYIAVPWYMLIDENGNIIEERAKSPSQIISGESLFTNN